MRASWDNRQLGKATIWLFTASQHQYPTAHWIWQNSGLATVYCMFRVMITHTAKTLVHRVRVWDDSPPCRTCSVTSTKSVTTLPEMTTLTGSQRTYKFLWCLLVPPLLSLSLADALSVRRLGLLSPLIVSPLTSQIVLQDGNPFGTDTASWW